MFAFIAFWETIFPKNHKKIKKVPSDPFLSASSPKTLQSNP